MTMGTLLMTDYTLRPMALRPFSRLSPMRAKVAGRLMLLQAATNNVPTRNNSQSVPNSYTR